MRNDVDSFFLLFQLTEKPQHRRGGWEGAKT